ncbi:energy transducer TonB [Hymenobacter daeguensis]
MKYLWLILLAGALATGPACERAFEAAAESTAPAAEVYTYVEEMPQLPGGGGNAAICAAIQKSIHIPPFQGDFPQGSRVMVEFTVPESGEVRDVYIIQSIDSRIDSEVVRAVKALPRLLPGRQQGRAVSVKYTMPITFHWQ